jgi:hypothetical protein
MLSRPSRGLDALIACGTARWIDDAVVELDLDADEAAQGGMVAISMRVAVGCAPCGGAGCDRCRGAGAVDELFSAWLAVPPDVVEGTVLDPSVLLPGMLRPVSFRVRRPRG